MSEETYTRPKPSMASQLHQRARRARIASETKQSPRDLALQVRKRRLAAQAASASASLPDGTSPKLRANLMAAQRRHDEDPAIQGTLARAKMAKRVQMAKEEAGLSRVGEPPKFMGMDAEELEREVQACVPPPMSSFRPGKAKKGKP